MDNNTLAIIKHQVSEWIQAQTDSLQAYDTYGLTEDTCFYEISFDNDYMINKVGHVYSKKSQKILTPDTSAGDVPRYKIGCVRKYIYQLLSQFLPYTLDDVKNKRNYIDHKDHNRQNNSLDNLRWTTASENSFNSDCSNNGNKFEYIDQLPSNCRQLLGYGAHEFNNYYYNLETYQLYYYVGFKYKLLHVTAKNLYTLVSNSGKKVNINKDKFRSFYKEE